MDTGGGRLTSTNLPPRIRGSTQPSSSLGGSTVRIEGRNGVCLFQLSHPRGGGIARAAETRARKERAGSMTVVRVSRCEKLAVAQYLAAQVHIGITCVRTECLLATAMSTTHDPVVEHGDPACPTDDGSDADAETASQRSIPLSSPAHSPHAATTPLRAQEFFSKRDSQGDSIEIDFGSETDEVNDSHSDRDARRASSITSVAPSTFSQPEPSKTHASTITYPPTSSSDTTDVDSFTSAASTYSRKARPESMLLQPPHGPLVLGIALVDFNHLVRLVGHNISSSRRSSTRLAPRLNLAKVTYSRTRRSRKCYLFLLFRTVLIWYAVFHLSPLRIKSHLSTQSLEDYSYFHLVPSTPNPSTVFGIS